MELPHESYKQSSQDCLNFLMSPLKASSEESFIELSKESSEKPSEESSNDFSNDSS